MTKLHGRHLVTCMMINISRDQCATILANNTKRKDAALIEARRSLAIDGHAIDSVPGLIEVQEANRSPVSMLIDA
jgi:hypothetical protein